VAGLLAYFLGKQEVHDAMLLPELNKMPLSTFNADFNQISSVLAKCGYWQAILTSECGENPFL